MLVLALVAWFTSTGHAQNCPGTGDCLEPHDTPGCANPGCCEEVCGLDPFCCEEWDLTCATLADLGCAGLCGAQASGTCFASNGSPACNDRNCCESVCLSDPFCCSDSWDSNCALFAGFFCKIPGGDCGDANAGDCFEPNGTPACNDTTCCDVVCSVDPTCCDLNWDVICAAIANDACLDACVVGTSPTDRVETEACDGPSNDACDGGTTEDLQPNRAMYGTFRSEADRDVVRVDATSLDSDGDGLIRLRFRVAAAAARVLIRTNDCNGTLVLESEAVACIATESIACVPAAPLILIVEPTGPVPDCDQPGWRIEVDFADTCGPTCGNDLDCLASHASPGCEDSDCCQLVCQQDPLCCDWTWDATCALAASEVCGGDPPANDSCADAIDIGLGSTPFRQLLATVSEPAGDCVDPARRGGDVWFRHEVVCDSLIRIGTCGTADFNTAVEIFEGGCGSLRQVECVDDEPFCSFETGSVFVDATCGDVYLVRVSGVDGGTGNGEVVVECFGAACPCREDLDGDGRVNGADLGKLFIDWGPCRRPCDADLDGDGEIGGSDLGLLFAAWGDC